MPQEAVKYAVLNSLVSLLSGVGAVLVQKKKKKKKKVMARLRVEKLDSCHLYLNQKAYRKNRC